MTGKTTAEIQKELAEYFDPREVKAKPQMVKQSRALAMFYIDARLVQDRLDSVMGIAGWKTEYVQVGTHSYECRLSLLLDGAWVTKADVGSTSEQPDEGDRTKAAYSDAIKRAAVAFGIGRYLYRLPALWCDYDPQKKQFTAAPRLPDWACPAKSRPADVETRAGKIERLIRMICERSQIDADKTIADTLKTSKVNRFADLPTAESDALLQRLNSKINELAKHPVGKGA